MGRCKNNKIISRKAFILELLFRSARAPIINTFVKLKRIRVKCGRINSLVKNAGMEPVNHEPRFTTAFRCQSLHVPIFSGQVMRNL